MKTFWIEYYNRGVAHITDQQPIDPKFHKTGTPYVNLLSKIVCDFNDWLTKQGGHRKQIHVKESRLLSLCHNL